MKELRRKDKKIEIAAAQEILYSAEYGILSTVGPDGQPYGVPLNYVYRNEAIFFHCALTGHKLDNLRSNPKVSFCVVGDTEVLPAKFSTHYISVVVMGKASESQGDERSAALLWLLEKYSPAFLEEGKEYIKQMDRATKVIKIEIEQVCGKKAPTKA